MLVFFYFGCIIACDRDFCFSRFLFVICVLFLIRRWLCLVDLALIMPPTFGCIPGDKLLRTIEFITAIWGVFSLTVCGELENYLIRLMSWIRDGRSPRVNEMILNIKFHPTLRNSWVDKLGSKSCHLVFYIWTFE